MVLRRTAMGLFDRFRSKKKTDGGDAGGTGGDERAAFRQELIDLLLERLGEVAGAPRLQIEKDANDPLVFSVPLESGTRVRCNLHPLHAETRDLDPEERALRLERHVRGFIAGLSGDSNPDTPPDWEQVQGRLVPVLRALQQYSSIPPAARPPGRRFDAGLIETAVIDFADTMQQISPQLLTKWGKTLDEVLAVAVSSLRSATSPKDVERLYDDAPTPIWHVARSDDYQSSRLLLPSWLASFRGKVNGRPIAIVPDRSTCIVAGDGDVDTVGRLIEIARSVYKESPRSISPIVYTIDAKDAVVPLTLPAGHPHHAGLRENRYHLLACEYGAQVQTLKQELAERGEDRYVAKYMVVEGGSGLMSVTTWAKGADSLLPVTEVIAFAVQDPDDESEWTYLQVPYAAVEELAGDCWESVPGLDPPRLRTLHWPSDETMDALRARQLVVN
jgi:hypothetical protein